MVGGGAAQARELRVGEAVQQVALHVVADEAAHDATGHVGDGHGRVDGGLARTVVARAADEATQDGGGALRHQDTRGFAVVHVAVAVEFGDEGAQHQVLVVVDVVFDALEEHVLDGAAVHEAEQTVVSDALVTLAIHHAVDALDEVSVAVEGAAERSGVDHGVVALEADRHPAEHAHVEVCLEVHDDAAAVVGRLAVQAVDVADEPCQAFLVADGDRMVLLIHFEAVIRHDGDVSDILRPETVEVDVVGVEVGAVGVVHRHIMIGVVKQHLIQDVALTRSELIKVSPTGAGIRAVDDGHVVVRHAEAHMRVFADTVLDDGDDVAVILRGVGVGHRSRQVDVVTCLVVGHIGLDGLAALERVGEVGVGSDGALGLGSIAHHDGTLQVDAAALHARRHVVPVEHGVAFQLERAFVVDVHAAAGSAGVVVVHEAIFEVDFTTVGIDGTTIDGRIVGHIAQR